MRNIFLTGFMGAGKSTVAKILSKKMGWTFIDLDRVIEQKTGKTISENFIDGEEKFREVESAVLSSVVESENQVVALGGGSIVNGTNRLKVLGAGQLIYLKAKSHTLAERLKKARDIRPLLEKQNDKESFIERLLRERESLYQAAHYTIITDGKSPEGVAQEVLLAIGNIFK